MASDRISESMLLLLVEISLNEFPLRWQRTERHYAFFPRGPLSVPLRTVRAIYARGLISKRPESNDYMWHMELTQRGRDILANEAALVDDYRDYRAECDARRAAERERKEAARMAKAPKDDTAMVIDILSGFPPPKSLHVAGTPRMPTGGSDAR